MQLLNGEEVETVSVSELLRTMLHASREQTLCHFEVACDVECSVAPCVQALRNISLGKHLTLRIEMLTTTGRTIPIKSFVSRHPLS